LKAKDRVAGKQVTCPRCSKRVWVPLESTPAADTTTADTTTEVPKRRPPLPKSADTDAPSSEAESPKSGSKATTGFFDWLFSSLFGKKEVPAPSAPDSWDEKHDGHDEQAEDPVFVPVGVSRSANKTAPAPENDDEMFTPLGKVKTPDPPKTDKVKGSKSNGGLCWSCGSSPCECG
jgi:hypothetical protein